MSRLMILIGSICFVFLGVQIVSGSYSCKFEENYIETALETIVYGMCFFLGNFIAGFTMILVGLFVFYRFFLKQ